MVDVNWSQKANYDLGDVVDFDGRACLVQAEGVPGQHKENGYLTKLYPPSTDSTKIQDNRIPLGDDVPYDLPILNKSKFKGWLYAIPGSEKNPGSEKARTNPPIEVGSI